MLKNNFLIKHFIINNSFKISQFFWTAFRILVHVLILLRDYRLLFAQNNKSNWRTSFFALLSNSTQRFSKYKKFPASPTQLQHILIFNNTFTQTARLCKSYDIHKTQYNRSKTLLVATWTMPYSSSAIPAYKKFYFYIYLYIVYLYISLFQHRHPKSMHDSIIYTTAIMFINLLHVLSWTMPYSSSAIPAYNNLRLFLFI